MYKVLSLCFTALMLVTVSGRPVTSVPQGYLKRAILTDIKILLNILPKDEGEDEGELYTPENTDSYAIPLSMNTSPPEIVVPLVDVTLLCSVKRTKLQVKCAREAMICYMKEIGALAQECEERTIVKTIERIQRNIGAALNYTSNTKATGRNSSQPSEPSNVTLAPFTSRREKDIAAKMNVCPPCESHELQKTTTFLERMIQFVQFALNDNGLKTLG